MPGRGPDGTQGLTAAFAARFAADWQAVLAAAGLPVDAKVGLAVSGGADSLGLMLLAHEVARRNFCVATVDHGLRRESAQEAALVAGLCAARAIAHRTLTLVMTAGSAVQERARGARYAALAQWAHEQGLCAIVTAHHADDQAETMVMRLNRGAGLRGLAAMRAVAATPGDPRLPLLRPLLSWRRADLATVVAGAGVLPVDDPSNRDPRYERVRVRDVMAAGDAFDANGFAASAAHLAQADAALDWAVDRLWRDAVVTDAGFTWNPPADLPAALALRMLERVLTAFGAPMPRGAELVRWHDSLRAGGVATLGGVKGDARRGGAGADGGPAAWRFTRAPGRAAKPDA